MEEHVDDQPVFPSELVQYEIVPHLDFEQLIDYCQTNRKARTFCEVRNVLEDRIMKMDYVERTEALLYWALSGSGVYTNRLLELLNHLFDRIDLHTLQLIRFYLVEQKMESEAEAIVKLYEEKKWGKKDDTDIESNEEDEDGEEEDEIESHSSGELDWLVSGFSAMLSISQMFLLDDIFVKERIYEDVGFLLNTAKKISTNKSKRYDRTKDFTEQRYKRISKTLRRIIGRLNNSASNTLDYLSDLLVVTMNETELSTVIDALTRYPNVVTKESHDYRHFFPYLYYSLHKANRMTEGLDALLRNEKHICRIKGVVSSKHYVKSMDDLYSALLEGYIPITTPLICKPEQMANLLVRIRQIGRNQSVSLLKQLFWLNNYTKNLKEWHKEVLRALRRDPRIEYDLKNHFGERQIVKGVLEETLV